MSIDLDALLVETASKIIVTYNEFGDVDYGNTSSSPCLYRDISTLNQSQNRYGVDIAGILWFNASEDVNRGDIYNHPSEGFLRIERITRAKTFLTDDSLQFIRCQVSKQRQIS